MLKRIISGFLLTLILATAALYFHSTQIFVSTLKSSIEQQGYNVSQIEMSQFGLAGCKINQISLSSDDQVTWQINATDVHLDYDYHFPLTIKVEDIHIKHLKLIMGKQSQSFSWEAIQAPLKELSSSSVNSIQIGTFETILSIHDQEIKLNTALDLNVKTLTTHLQGHLHPKDANPFDVLRFSGELGVSLPPTLQLKPGFMVQAKHVNIHDAKVHKLKLIAEKAISFNYDPRDNLFNIDSDALFVGVQKLTLNDEDYYFERLNFSPLRLNVKEGLWSWEGKAHGKLARVENEAVVFDLSSRGSKDKFSLEGTLKQISQTFPLIDISSSGQIKSFQEPEIWLEDTVLEFGLSKDAQFKFDYAKLSPVLPVKLFKQAGSGDWFINANDYNLTLAAFRFYDVHVKNKGLTLKLDNLNVTKFEPIKGLIKGAKVKAKFDDIIVDESDTDVNFEWLGDKLISKWAFKDPLDLGLTLDQLKFDFNYYNQANDNDRYEFKNIKAGVFGGHIACDTFEINRAKKIKPFIVKLSDVKLEQMLKWRELDGLSGKGRLDGQLPFAQTPTGLMVDNGRFSARPPGGFLSYTPANPPQTDVPGMQMAFDALKDFKFSQLTGKIQYKPDGWMDMRISLAGKSHLLSENRPIEFNLNLKENMKDLFTSLTIHKQFEQ